MIRQATCRCILVLVSANLCAAQTTRSVEIQGHYQRAQDALAKSDYDTAASEFSAILRLDPNRAEIHANLGTVYYAQSRYADASAEFRKSGSLKGVDAFLGMSEARLGHIKEALPLLEKGFRNPLNEQWKLEAGLLLADAYQNTGDSAKLHDTLATLNREFHNNPEVLYLTYRIHSTLATRAVSGLAKAASDSARLRQIAAELLEAEGDSPGAVHQYRKALELEPKLPGVRRALGVALMNNSTDQASRLEARRQFEEELSRNPSDALSEYQLGELAWIDNQPAEAMKHFQRAIDLQPNFPDALIGAGKVLLSMNQNDKAIPLLEKAVSLDPSSEVAHYRLAQAFQRSGNKARAAQSLAEFRRLQSAAESLRGIYKQVLENRITAQRIE